MMEKTRAAARWSAAIAFGLSLSASAASLNGSLSQMVGRWENGDPRLSPMLAKHLTSAGGDPVVLVHLAEGVDQAQALSELSAIGFRLTAISSIDPRMVEGYLPLGSARAAAGVPSVAGLRAQHR